MPPGQTADFVRTVARQRGAAAGPHDSVLQLAPQGQPLRQGRTDRAQLYLCGDVIVKLHPVGTDPALLSSRLHSITRPGMDRFWIQPVDAPPTPAPNGRLATLWPQVATLALTDQPPWTHLGHLLAGLHRAPTAGTPLPPAGTPSRLARSIDYLRTHPPGALAWLADVGDDITRRLQEPHRTTMIHGDLHLGQLGRPSGGQWKLLDPDDTGSGDPAWDLARPAGLWAAGLLDDTSWAALLAAYRDAGGPAVPATGSPWTDLDLPARAAILTATAQALRTPGHPDTTRTLIDACRRIRDR